MDGPSPGQRSTSSQEVGFDVNEQVIDAHECSSSQSMAIVVGRWKRGNEGTRYTLRSLQKETEMIESNLM